MNKIGKIIQDALKEKGFAQKEFAERIGVTPQAVSKWIHDDVQRIDSDNMQLINDVLGVNLIREKNNIERKEKRTTMKQKHNELKNLDSIDKAKAEATMLLEEAGINENYSHIVNTLMHWFVTAVIGLTYHQMLHVKRTDDECDYSRDDIFYNLDDFFHEDCKYEDNCLAYSFYLMGMDLFESFGDDKIINHDYAREADDLWYRTSDILKRIKKLPQYGEFIVALKELIAIYEEE